MLQQIPGLEVPKPHKPKQKPAKKAQHLCDELGIVDAIVPLLDVLWRRFEDDKSGRNEFEKALMAEFEAFDTRERDAMQAAFKGYRKARHSGKIECLFNDCLAGAAKDEPIAVEWVADELIREGLAFAMKTFFKGSNGIMTAGQVRQWDNVIQRPDEKAKTYTGPWPWLTAVCPDVSSYEEYGNRFSFRPAPPATSHIWENYQYAQTCEFKQDSSGKVFAECRRVTPPAPPPGSFSFAICEEGGDDYTVGNECLRIPSIRGGGSIKLRGFNFITPAVTVRMVKQDEPSLRVEQQSAVFGDSETPLQGPDGKTIVDERVRDWVDFAIPRNHPSQPGSPLPPGLYALTVLVDNVTQANFDGSVPPRLETNRLLVKIEPDPNVRYLLWSERGRCNQETPGWGADEIWWDAFVGQLIPNQVPVPPSPDTSGLELRTDHKEFPRGPWDDMDSGESSGLYKRDLFGPAAFELGGVVAVGLVGFEVDDEDSAKEQVANFGQAYWKALKAVAAVALSGESLLVAILQKVALSVALIVVAVVAAVILVAIAFWAAWAPADLIALDVFTLDALNAWDATDPRKPLTPEVKYKFGNVTVFHTPMRKLGKPTDAAATWVGEHDYETPADDEASSYVLEFRLART